MPRQSISFTTPNERWLASQVDSEEFSSKSEVINDLIRRARRKEERLAAIRGQLKVGEESAISSKTKEELLAEIKERNGLDG